MKSNTIQNNEFASMTDKEVAEWNNEVVRNRAAFLAAWNTKGSKLTSEEIEEVCSGRK